jgi:predicted porin
MKKILLATLVSSFSLTAIAETPSFNFLEIGQTQLGVSNSAEKSNGFELDFNFELNDDFYLSADHASVSVGNDDSKVTNIGIGFKSDVSNSSTFYSQIDWTKLTENDGYDEDGYRLSIGIRSMFTKQLELNAGYEYMDISADTENYYVVGAAYNFNDDFSVYSDYKYASEIDQLSLGVRFNF